MQYVNEAKILNGADLIKKIESSQETNPTVEDMVFIETRTKNGETKVFPGYAVAWREDKEHGEGPVWPIDFKFRIVQIMNGDIGLLEVVLHEKDFGVRQRIWDGPVSDETRAGIPFIEPGIQ